MDVLGNGPSELCSGAYIGFLKGGQMFAGHTKWPHKMATQNGRQKLKMAAAKLILCVFLLTREYVYKDSQ